MPLLQGLLKMAGLSSRFWAAFLGTGIAGCSTFLVQVLLQHGKEPFLRDLMQPSLQTFKHGAVAPYMFIRCERQGSVPCSHRLLWLPLSYQADFQEHWQGGMPVAFDTRCTNL